MPSGCSPRMARQRCLQHRHAPMLHACLMAAPSPLPCKCRLQQPARLCGRPAPPRSTAGRPSPAAPPFAVVGDTTISAADYQRALGVAMRKKYYHAKPPEAELAQPSSARWATTWSTACCCWPRPGAAACSPTATSIKATVAGYDRQYKGSATGPANREKMLANAVTPQLESESLLERLEIAGASRGARTRRGRRPAPTTTSTRTCSSSPSRSSSASSCCAWTPVHAPGDAWNSAQGRGRADPAPPASPAGADFADLARLHSNDRSAAQGGADGLHPPRHAARGRCTAVVDKLAAAAAWPNRCSCSKVLPMLRLDAPPPGAAAQLTSRCAQRAAELWQRERGRERAGRSLIAELRGRHAHPKIDESHYAPLPGPGEHTPRAG